MCQKLIILLFLFSKVSSAQEYCKYNKSKFKPLIEDFTIFGIAHGTDISAPNNVLPKSDGTLFNLGIGVSLKTRIFRNEYLKAELSIIQKGSHYSFSNQPRKSIRLNYIEIPILWSHCFVRRKNTFYFETGFAVSTLILSSKQIAVFAKQSQLLNAQNFKRVDIPLIASIKTPLFSKRRNNFLIGFRFSYSPISIHNSFKTKSILMYQDDGMHHISYGIQIDYKFTR